MHALRSLPGLPAIVLLAAVGAVAGYQRLARRRRSTARAAALVLGAIALLETARFLWLLFAEHPRRPAVYHAFHTDLMNACDWLRPRLGKVDAVFCTPTAMNMPFAVALVGLQYEPARWSFEQHTVVSVGGWDFYVRAGKLHFLYGRQWEPALHELERNGRPDRVVFLLRPGELGLRDPVTTIDGPVETQPLLIFERTL